MCNVYVRARTVLKIETNDLVNGRYLHYIYEQGSEWYESNFSRSYGQQWNIEI